MGDPQEVRDMEEDMQEGSKTRNADEYGILSCFYLPKLKKKLKSFVRCHHFGRPDSLLLGFNSIQSIS